MSTMTPLEVANRWLEAYNAREYEVTRQLAHPNIVLFHHNRGFEIHGADAVVAGFEGFTKLGPDKRYHEPKGQWVDGDVVITHHEWSFTAAAPVPEFDAQPGDHISVDLASIWTIRDGLLVEYHDFG